MSNRLLGMVLVWAVCFSIPQVAAELGGTAVEHPGDNLCLPADMDAKYKNNRSFLRVATFNAFLNRNTDGELLADLLDATDQVDADDSADIQIRAVAEIIQRVRPDVLLLNEFDFDANGTSLQLFLHNYLGVGQNGARPIRYEYQFNQPSNTGLPTGMDLDNDGSTTGPGDAQGFGFFPGQFGMAVLSRYPINEKASRTFQKFLWRDMPGNLIPEGFYAQAELDVLRLSSKSHWDVVVEFNHQPVHILAAHPTPPVFDGPEDRNGRRNHDEIRFWADYVRRGKSNHYIYDDNGRRGGLRGRQPFVIVGDYNADPEDGDSTDAAILQLLGHRRINAGMPPASFGGVEDTATEGQANLGHSGNAAFDTADFNAAGPGNLRVDFVLPSQEGAEILCGGVYWPQRTDETRYLVGEGFPVVSSDHRLVWQDLLIKSR